MHFPTRTLFAAVAALWIGGPAAVHLAAESEAPDVRTVTIDGQEWYELFNGENLDGWRPAEENPHVFSVEDGKIVIDGPRSHLFYDGPVAGADFKDFHFRSEVYTYPRANSGIFFHTRWQARGWPSVGYEAQVNATHRDRIKTGSVYGVSNVLDDAPHNDEEWFLYEIIVKGDRIILKVDGETVMDYTEREEDIRGQRRLSSGTFALQAHDPGSRMYFRNIYVRPLEGDTFPIVEAPDAAAEGLVNVVQPNDPIVPLPADDSPEDEGVRNAIDGDANTKYLNFRGHREPAGFEVTIGRPAVVTALRLTSADDAPERDPAGYRIEGATADGEWVEIAAGSLEPFRGRHAAQAVRFDNDRAFTRYRVLFPEVRDAGSANSMQIALAELMAEPSDP